MEVKTVDLRGYKLNNAVFINGKQLEPKTTTKFDWGWYCDGLYKLAFEILEYIDGSEVAYNHHELFGQVFLRYLPANFHIRIKYDEWKSALNSEKIVISWQLFDIILNETTTIPAIVDLTLMDIKQGEFKQGTIEFELFSKLDLDTINEYYKFRTIRPDISDMNKQVWASVKYNALNNSYEYENGLGSIVGYSGCKN